MQVVTQIVVIIRRLQKKKYTPTKRIKKKKKINKSSSKIENDAIKMNFKDLPMKAQEIIKTIKQCKKFVRYITKGNLYALMLVCLNMFIFKK